MSTDPVVVDDTSLMGPWRFRKHINLRHIPVGDYRSERERDGRTIVSDITELSIRKCYKDDRPPHEEYHARMHRLHPERYDHVHE